MAQWEPETYRIQRMRNEDTNTGETWGVWGVGPSVEFAGERMVVVTHLPSGMQFGPAWESTQKAKAFAEAADTLRRDWADIRDAREFTPAFRTSVWDIVSRIDHDAEVPS